MDEKRPTMREGLPRVLPDGVVLTNTLGAKLPNLRMSDHLHPRSRQGVSALGAQVTLEATISKYAVSGRR